MKNLIKLILTICTFINVANAQYGERIYPHPGSILSAAKVTNINSTGFIMAGYRPNAVGNNQVDIVIDKTDLAGIIPAAGTFNQHFFINYDPACASPINMSIPHGCIGVDIIETNPVGAVRYALTGGFTGGVFFATLDATGNIISQRFWRIDLNGSEFKPAIVESATPGFYYMCGNAAGSSYVIKVNSTGGIVWTRWYNNVTIYARDLIESPYNPSELIVVGRVEDINLAAEAFFLKLNSGTGSLINFTCYSDGGNGDEWFTSIEPAASTVGGSNGYIVGGRVYSLITYNTGYTPWMIKLDQNGNVMWSTLIQHSNAYTPLEISDVFERLNTSVTPAVYEYFGVAHTPIGAQDYMTSGG